MNSRTRRRRKHARDSREKKRFVSMLGLALVRKRLAAAPGQQVTG
jgi:hypothetical protein